METVKANAVIIKNRIRKDLGDIPGLAKSIEENGLIEPIVLADFEEDGTKYVKLIAGERRLTALKSLGLKELEHGIHFVWRHELKGDDPKVRLLASSIEMEENLRRKDLSWVEQITGKQRLLEIMQQIYGPPTGGAPTRDQRVGLSEKGFGVRKLSEMLGESPAQTSEDLQLAALVQQIPALKTEDSKEAAKRRLGLATKIITGNAQPKVATALSYRIMIICDNEEHQKHLLNQLRGAGLKCLPVVS
jgi:ParB-like nuclease domain